MTHLDFTRRGLLGGAAALSAAGSAGFARGAFAGQVENNEDDRRESERYDGKGRAHRGRVAELALLEGRNSRRAAMSSSAKPM